MRLSLLLRALDPDSSGGGESLESPINDEDLVTIARPNSTNCGRGPREQATWRTKP